MKLVSAIRLTESERTQILDSVQLVSKKSGIEIYRIALFGSRIDPQKKGGDIDLYIQCGHNDATDLDNYKRMIRREIQDRIGEQKLDVVVDDGQVNLGAFRDVILKTKVDLWTRN